MTTIREALQAIYDEHGHLTPHLVLDAARDTTSPLHTHINWDDTEAAERWRHHQAATIIRKVKIRIIDPGKQETIRVRAWTHVSTEDGHRYLDTGEVAASAKLSHMVRVELMDQLRVLREKLRRFDEFAAIVAAIDQLDQTA